MAPTTASRYNRRREYKGVVPMVRASRGAGDPVNLADVPPFRLGDVEVHPSTRQLIRDGRSETLEPRLMQVLVVLAEPRVPSSRATS